MWRVLLGEVPSALPCFFPSCPFQSSVQASHPRVVWWWLREGGEHRVLLWVSSAPCCSAHPPTPCLSHSTGLSPSRSQGYYSHLMALGPNTMFGWDKMQKQYILSKGHHFMRALLVCQVTCSSQCGLMLISSRENVLLCAGLASSWFTHSDSDQRIYQKMSGIPEEQVQMSEHKLLWVLEKGYQVCLLQCLRFSLLCSYYVNNRWAMEPSINITYSKISFLFL